ncbi:MAG: choice-of-anchor tandem repeat GloVer-containing protein [Acidobacteriota bacterium]
MITFLRRLVLLFLLGLLPAVSVNAAEVSYSILHSFQGAERYPEASLTSDGRGNLYGTTAYGGSWDFGTIFAVRTDGTEFRRLHTFAGGSGDGGYSYAPLIFDGAGTLYGTTTRGGSSDAGTVFRINVDGGGFQVLHMFGGGPGDGANPYASLTLDGTGVLHGTTVGGGPSNGGTVFKLRTDGSGFRLLHAFAGGASDGRSPRASLLLDESGNLYGTTNYGGQPAVYNAFGDIIDGAGTVFRIKTDGTGFRLLRAFTIDLTDVAPAPDGQYPSGALTSDGSGNLFGMTIGGGEAGGGTVFKIGTDGSSFRILHLFAGNDGWHPVGSLVLDRAGNLYGMTADGGTGNQATIFKVKTDATEYQVLRTFVDAPDGKGPTGSLILDGPGTLYGTMAYGGSSSSGTVFRISTGGNLFQVLYAFAGFSNDGGRPWASLIPDGSGYLYGTTAFGGFSYEGIVFRIRSDGTGFRLLHAFSGGLDDGAEPRASLLLDRAGNLYGTTTRGGLSDRGIAFKLRKDGTSFQLIHTFIGGASDGARPLSGLILDGADNLYGTTSEGGLSDLGTVFRMKTDGTGFQLLHEFTVNATGGAPPFASLVLDGSGNLYGTTLYGGSGLHGTIFKLRSDGTGFLVLHSFTDRADDGKWPSAPLIVDGVGNLYGTTSSGGSSGLGGTVFTLRADGTGFHVLHSFTGDRSDGGGPTGVIRDAFGNLYGTTNSGGPSQAGTIYTLRTDGTAYQVLHSFGDEPGDGRNPVASLFFDGSGTLVGTTLGGGVGGTGTVFALSIGGRRTVVMPGPFVPVRRR